MRTFDTPEAQKVEVDRNVRAYRRAHRRYEKKHGEIFNEVEQTRLRRSLEAAVACGTDSEARPHALDLGCGSGNVTAHLLDLGLEVTAADVSPEFLRHVRRRFAGRQLQTLLLNGMDLAQLPDDALDMVTAYSVLHHVPNYLDMIGEMHRVLRPGGVLYLDHEVNDLFWEEGGCLDELRAEVRERALADTKLWNPERRRWQRFLVPSRYLARLRTAIDPEWWWKIEGDIHTWKEDHIEWDRIVASLDDGGAEIVSCEDYLVYRAEYPRDLYERYRGKCSDMRMMAFRKASAEVS